VQPRRSNRPVPPPALAARVGSKRHEGAHSVYARVGGEARERILRLLPDDWSFAGKRVLDFGCGSGRTLRRFLAEAEEAELVGCDVHAPSVDWVNANLSPVRAYQSRQWPPLPEADASFDLVWAISVFTHLTDSWSSWLLELHRLLRPGGLLIATVAGPRVGSDLLGEPWEEDAIGMTVIRHWQDFDQGGPIVVHSEWWLRGHWGRAFELSAIERPAREARDHTWLLLERRDPAPTREELERPLADPREVEALRHNLELAQREIESVRGHPLWRTAGAAAALRRRLRRR
jgi:SAM-dependent methyltransferase